MGATLVSPGEPFQTWVPAKVVLSGEHAVLRGQPAVCLPFPDMGLSLRFDPQKGKGLRVLPEAWGEPVLKLLKRSGVQTLPEGLITVGSTIPTQAGLGSSAALSVAMVRLLSGEDLDPSVQWSRARELEHEFHGVSSGMDVAAVAAAGPVWFENGRAQKIEHRKMSFRLSVHDSGVRSSTQAMVAKVRSHPNTEKLDRLMGQASELVRSSLERGDLADLAMGIQEARDCFEAWELIPPEVVEMEKRLRKAGALATKPTGAGGGGFVLAVSPS